MEWLRGALGTPDRVTRRPRTGGPLRAHLKNGPQLRPPRDHHLAAQSILLARWRRVFARPPAKQIARARPLISRTPEVAAHAQVRRGPLCKIDNAQGECSAHCFTARRVRVQSIGRQFGAGAQIEAPDKERKNVFMRPARCCYRQHSNCWPRSRPPGPRSAPFCIAAAGRRQISLMGRQLAAGLRATGALGSRDTRLFAGGGGGQRTSERRTRFVCLKARNWHGADQVVASCCGQQI